MRRYGLVLAAAGVAIAVTVPTAASAADTASGWQWTSEAVAPGVTVEVGVLQGASAPFWTVTIDAPATNSLTGRPTVAELGSQQWAQDSAERLVAAGYQPRVDAVDWPPFADTPRGVEGFRVRTGDYATQADAVAAVAALKGCRVQHSRRGVDRLRRRPGAGCRAGACRGHRPAGVPRVRRRDS